MFFVLNKSKIYSYVIALCTVVVLFVAAAKLNDVVSPNIIETSANSISNNVVSSSSNNVTITNNIIEENNIKNEIEITNNIMDNLVIVE